MLLTSGPATEDRFLVQRAFTKEEVAKQDHLLVVNDKIYDLKRFSQRNEGGAEALRSMAETEEKADRYVIGRIRDDKASSSTSSAFGEASRSASTNENAMARPAQHPMDTMNRIFAKQPYDTNQHPTVDTRFDQDRGQATTAAGGRPEASRPEENRNVFTPGPLLLTTTAEELQLVGKGGKDDICTPSTQAASSVAFSSMASMPSMSFANSLAGGFASMPSHCGQ
ncbi:unnamed protein product [Amoebophrya sp. A120]|nr:unnamed protein product [Amoebophrya sp. A120]|eukprot:GSA120T00003466001.1